MVKLLGMAIGLGLVSSGCIHGHGGTNGDDDCYAKTSSTYAVVIGMENSKFAGACPGARYDSDRMKSLLSKYASEVRILQDESATKANVRAAIEWGIEKSGSGLFVFYYSGHGGSDPFSDTGVEESDGKDEYLCLYDTYLRDNEIWSMICKSKGRVFFITDSCHSETQFRTPKFLLRPPFGFDHKINEVHPFSLLCWSGCPDADFSYGSSSGGQFTNALLRQYKKDLTYQELWDKIKSDRVLRAYENPQSTIIGAGFEGKKGLR